MIDFNTNREYYDNLPQDISWREDLVKAWWQSAIDFTFHNIILDDKIILEIGAGKGFLKTLYPFSPQNIFYTDISFNRFSMNTYNILFPGKSFGIFNDVNTPCFQENVCDIILFVNCLMFVENKTALIEQYKKFLKTCGYIIILDVLDGNPFYRLRKKFSTDYERVSVKNITYNDIESICRKNDIKKKKYFYYLSILSAPLLLKFPNQKLVRRIHGWIEKLDGYLLSIKAIQPNAVLASVVLEKK